ncbi:hypothetical protein GH733_005048 [Mirounga leonina]|nr:hypothetical protein GH733_005048 [Mirounga leonina]
MGLDWKGSLALRDHRGHTWWRGRGVLVLSSRGDRAGTQAVHTAEANGPADGYAAIAQADRLTQEPESIRKWREEQRKRLQELDAASKVTEQEWREKAKKDLEEWNQRQSEQVEKNKINNRIADKAFYQQPDADIIGYVASEEAFVKESKEETPGTEWEKVAQLCDFNPKSSKQCKDVSRLRSVLMSLKQTPLSR